MAKRDLNELKDRLWDAFERVTQVAQTDIDVNNMSNRTLAGKLFTSAAEIAKAIASVEREQRELQSDGRFTGKLPGKEP